MLTRKTPIARKPMKRRGPNATVKADVEFSLQIRARDKCCQRCGSSDGLQCAHIWSRRYRSLRWKAENAIALCRGCHTYMTLRPAEWAEWCEEHSFSKLGIGGAIPSGWMGTILVVPVGTSVISEPGLAVFTYAQLRQRALNDPPEKAADALARLRATGSTP